MKFYILLLMFLFSLTIAHAQFVSDDPIDCDPGNPNIFPGQIEVCNDGIDNNCNIDEGFLFDDDPTTGVDEKDISCCNIIDARWILNKIEISTATDQTLVTLEAIGTAACNGEIVNFEIWESEGFFLNDDKVPYFEFDNFVNNTAEVTWIAEWIADGFLQGDPEYYFNSSSEFISRLSEELRVTQQFPECGDGNLDEGETCLSCAADAGCGVGFKGCNVEGVPTCVPSDQVCDNPITSPACTDNLCCFPGSLCQLDGNGNPSCGCNPVSDGICSADPACSDNDPDCCSITSIGWSESCAGNGQPVDLIIKTSNACNNLEASFDIKEDDGLLEEDYSPDPDNEQVVENEARARWTAEWISDFGTDPEFFFYGDIPSLQDFSQVRSDIPDLKVRQCDLSVDSDCDGILDTKDICKNTVYCSSVDDEGCTDGQASCIQDWDCSNAPWSECTPQTDFSIRDVSLCVYQGTDPACSDSSILVSVRSCAEEKPFPVFDYSNILIVAFILVLYYLVKRLK